MFSIFVGHCMRNYFQHMLHIHKMYPEIKVWPYVL